ncbi:protein SHI RELATED SEQUENCE 3-like [Gastrolobium bilobum]|uniref:protein SHI RELATED SEQUENCE 3-like n=1 Tax=Gastrolobium bilobum TaxID=150636 RepID=UPI002AB29A16|nr:protein SHI RELATED SEQUENCE 3-like [Gastrolobium bilobum]
MQGQEVVVRGPKCQDCGNQAKKDCSYFRCRTCCKNKGFQCQTHIKSTWMPVDRRRQSEEQPCPTTNPPDFQPNQNPYSGLEQFKFPATVNSTAIFRCIQVHSMDDAINEVAYQTSVNIGGHVFTGLLFNQGPDRSFYARGDSSTGLVDQQQNLNHIDAPSVHTNDGATMAPLSASATHDDPFLSPPLYPFPLPPLRPGMPYFSIPRP